MAEADHIYFARRGAEERQAAQRASTAQGRKSHEELAVRYEDVARSLEALSRRINVDIDRAARNTHAAT